MDIISISMSMPPLASAPATAAPLRAADSLATARFAEVMNAGPAVEAAAQLAAPTPRAAIPPATQTLGDNILNGMQNLSAEFQQSWKTVNAALDTNNMMTTQDMLKLQMGLTQMSIQYDLVGKAISRSTQNLDQLVKLQ